MQCENNLVGPHGSLTAVSLPPGIQETSSFSLGVVREFGRQSLLEDLQKLRYPQETSLHEGKQMIAAGISVHVSSAEKILYFIYSNILYFTCNIYNPWLTLSSLQGERMK